MGGNETIVSSGVKITLKTHCADAQTDFNLHCGHL